jgi:hypothetical protein
MENKHGQKLQLVTPTTKEVVRWSADDKNLLAQALGQVCTVQRAYGKTAADLPVMVNGFSWALRSYPVKRVIEALGEFMLQSPNIPTPFEIRQIIDPPKAAFVPDKPYYVRLQKLKSEQGKYALNDDEEEYIRRYEEHIKRGLPND